jgi:hypothetical protein
MINRSRRFVWWSLLLALPAGLFLYAFALLFGNLNQDEGWYLYAAQRVSEGAMPYRDFFFTQGPVMPYVYGALEKVWAPFGVLGGRLVTVFFGILSCVATAFLARCAVPRDRAFATTVMGAALSGCNIYHVYFTTIPKTYALASSLIMIGYVLLFFGARGNMKCPAWLCSLLAGILIACAAGTRISMGMLLPITAVAMMLTWRQTGKAWFWFSLGAGLGLAVVYLPSLLFAREQFIFAQTFHAARKGRDLVFLVGSVSRIVRFYLPVAMLASALIIFQVFRAKHAVHSKSRPVLNDWPLIWFMAFLGVFIVQLLSPYPYDDYQVPVMGLLIAAVVGWAMQVVPEGLCGRVCLFVTVLSLGATFGSSLPQEWLMAKQDRFWAIKKTEPDILKLRSVAAAHFSKDPAPLLTQDVYLAVESGRKVPEGLEMGPFCYFPGLSDAEAKKYHVLNKAAMLELLEKAPCSMAAVSGYGFAVRSPVMDEVPAEDQKLFRETLLRNYTLTQTIDAFGQNSTKLEIYQRKPSSSL